MGRETRVDVSAVHNAAGEFDGSVQTLDGALRVHLSRLSFGGAVSGRAHVARGDALSAAVDGLADAVVMWARATSEIAATLRAGADRYAAVEDRNSARFG